MSDMVGNPEDLFSCDVARIISTCLPVIHQNYYSTDGSYYINLFTSDSSKLLQHRFKQHDMTCDKVKFSDWKPGHLGNNLQQIVHASL